MIVRLLSQHSLERWLPFPETFSGESGPVLEDRYYVFTFKLLQNLHLEESRLLRSCFVHCLSFKDEYSPPLGPAEKRRKLCSLGLSLLRARDEILAHVAERCALRGLHMNSAKKENELS